MKKPSRKAQMFRCMVGGIVAIEQSFIENTVDCEDDIYGTLENIYIPTRHLQDYEHIPEYVDKIEDDFIKTIDGLVIGEYYEGFFTNDFPCYPKVERSRRKKVLNHEYW